MDERNYRERFDELADAVRNFLALSWTGTDDKGRCTYVDYHNASTRIESLLSENLSPIENSTAAETIYAQTENTAISCKAVRVKTALANNGQEPIEGSVRLIPTNEGHEMCYSERYSGTEEKIFARTDSILKVLNEIFPDGTWMVKIESNDVSEAIYLDQMNIYDAEFNIIRKIHGESFVKHL